MLHGNKCEMKIHGDMFQGSFVNGSRQGFGRIVYANGDQYYGQFNNNEAEGFGIKVSRNGKLSLGQYKNSKKHGFCYITNDLNSKNCKLYR